MKIKLHIDYHTVWGQNIYVCGSCPELGNWDEKKALKMTCTSSSEWIVDFETNDTSIEYRYIVKENEIVSCPI